MILRVTLRPRDDDGPPSDYATVHHADCTAEVYLDTSDGDCWPSIAVDDSKRLTFAAIDAIEQAAVDAWASARDGGWPGLDRYNAGLVVSARRSA